jgi:hypothetical protein
MHQLSRLRKSAIRQCARAFTQVETDPSCTGHIGGRRQGWSLGALAVAPALFRRCDGSNQTRIPPDSVELWMFVEQSAPLTAATASIVKPTGDGREQQIGLLHGQCKRGCLRPRIRSRLHGQSVGSGWGSGRVRKRIAGAATPSTGNQKQDCQRGEPKISAP